MGQLETAARLSALARFARRRAVAASSSKRFSSTEGSTPKAQAAAESAVRLRRKRRDDAADAFAKRLADLPQQERQRVHVEEIIRRKEATLGRTRCPKCWFPVNQTGTSFCVCDRMPPLGFERNLRFLVYMHHRELYNCGDDAKILLCAAPGVAEIFVHGRPGDDDRLRALVAGARSALLLFPGDDAISVEDFIAQQGLHSAGEGEVGEDAGDAALAIVVLDGTWDNVKQLRKHFLRGVCPAVPCVRLRPLGQSVYARTQTRADGVSTVEAVALLLRELGEADDVCAALVRYVEINNEALAWRHGIPSEHNSQNT